MPTTAEIVGVTSPWQTVAAAHIAASSVVKQLAARGVEASELPSEYAEKLLTAT